MAAIRDNEPDASRQERMRTAPTELKQLLARRFCDQPVDNVSAGEWERFLIANWDRLSELAHLIHARPR